MAAVRQFTFNGQTSVDNDIIVTRIQRPILPTLRRRKLVIAGKDGAWDFGNNTYEESQILVECELINPLSKRALIRALALWLSEKGQLSFSDEYDKYYAGRLYDTFTEEIDGVVGRFALTFEVDPFAYSILKTTDEVLLGDDIPLGSDVSLGNSENYIFDITGPGSLDIDNFGTQSIRPTIIIDGSIDDITISVNGKSLTYTGPISSQELILDGANYLAELDGVNVLDDLTGDIDDFLTLQPGNNTVTITGTNLNCNIQFEFRPLYY